VVAAAISAEVDGQTYYFCAQGCRNVFVREPAAFLGPDAGDHEHHHH